MVEFFQSKFIKDLQDGKLPDVEVKISDESLLQLFGGMFLTALAILLVAKILNSL